MERCVSLALLPPLAAIIGLVVVGFPMFLLYTPFLLVKTKEEDDEMQTQKIPIDILV